MARTGNRLLGLAAGGAAAAGRRGGGSRGATLEVRWPLGACSCSLIAAEASDESAGLAGAAARAQGGMRVAWAALSDNRQLSDARRGQTVWCGRARCGGGAAQRAVLVPSIRGGGAGSQGCTQIVHKPSPASPCPADIAAMIGCAAEPGRCSTADASPSRVQYMPPRLLSPPRTAQWLAIHAAGLPLVMATGAMPVGRPFQLPRLPWNHFAGDTSGMGIMAPAAAAAQPRSCPLPDRAPITIAAVCKGPAASSCPLVNPAQASPV